MALRSRCGRRAGRASQVVEQALEFGRLGKHGARGRTQPVHRLGVENERGRQLVQVFALGAIPQRGEFVFTEEWYDGLFGLDAGEQMDDAFWAEILTVRGEVNKALEAARGEKRIGGSLQAELTLFAKPELAARLNALADELRFVLLTSKAKVVSVDAAPAEAVATERDDLWLCVAQSAAAKCDRCWHHVEDVGTIAGHEEICGRCVTNVEGDGETRQFA